MPPVYSIVLSGTLTTDYTGTFPISQVPYYFLLLAKNQARGGLQ